MRHVPNRNWSGLGDIPCLTVLHTVPLGAGRAVAVPPAQDEAQVLLDRSPTAVEFLEATGRDAFGTPAWALRGQADIWRRGAPDSCGLEIRGYDLP